MPDASCTIEIVERDGSIVRIVGHSARGSIEVVAELGWNADTLVLSGLHADGSGPGALGLGEVREYARQFARQQGAAAIMVYGGTRTTGARPGKQPRPVLIRVKE